MNLCGCTQYCPHSIQQTIKPIFTFVKVSGFSPTETDYLNIKSLARQKLEEQKQYDEDNVAKAWTLATLEYLNSLGFMFNRENT